MKNAHRWLTQLAGPGLIAGLVLLAACSGPLQPPQFAPAAAPATTPLPPGAAETPADPTAACPAAVDGATLYVSTENGLCFLYPSELQPSPDPHYPDDIVQLTGAPLEPGAMETISLNLTVAHNGPADRLDSAQYATVWMQRSAPALDLPQTAVTIGGQPAIVVDNLPGWNHQRSAFVIANGARYQITLTPQPQDVPELAAAATHAWDTVTQSLTFFAPQRADTVVRPADVCPAAFADTHLLLDEVGGYCLLYPADFNLDPSLTGTLVGGPELGPFADFRSVRASLTVAGAYPLAGMTPEQVLQPPLESTDPNSVAATTVAGYPAVIYDFVSGPWRQRNAVVLVDDRYYTFVTQPWDPDLFPQALPDVQRLWNTANQSIAFFTPWR